MTLRQVPQLKRKKPHQRGPVDPDSLTAAVRWDVLMDPALPVDPAAGPTHQRPLEGKAQVDSLEVPTLDPGPGPVLEALKGGQDQRRQPADPGPTDADQDPGAHLGHALELAKALLEKGSATSGNWAHAGRPGHRGGSAAGGGLAAIGVKPGHSGYDKLGIVSAKRRKRGDLQMPKTDRHPMALAGKTKAESKAWAKAYALGIINGPIAGGDPSMVNLGNVAADLERDFFLSYSEATKITQAAVDTANKNMSAQLAGEAKKQAARAEQWEEWDKEKVTAEADIRIQTRIEEPTYHLGSEIAALTSIDGKDMVLQKTGGVDFVAFNDEELAQFPGNILSHNHPSGTAFSPEDLLMAVQHDLRQVRANGVIDKGADQGTAYVYTASPSAGVRALGVDGLRAEIDNANATTRREFWSKINDGSMSILDAEASHWHETHTRVDKALQAQGIGSLNYSRRKVDIDVLRQERRRQITLGRD